MPSLNFSETGTLSTNNMQQTPGQNTIFERDKIEYRNMKEHDSQQNRDKDATIMMLEKQLELKDREYKELEFQL